MIKIAQIGLGFMGKTHLEVYEKLKSEGIAIEVVALCDIDPAKMEPGAAVGNIESSNTPAIDYSSYRKYTSVTELLEKEQLDAVDIALPSYLHKEISVQCLDKGVHVLCEKPMALTTEDCHAMTEAAKRNNRNLLIGQCLRFWPAYVYLKQAIENNTFGEVRAASFFRGGATPTWGPWLMKKELSGGALMDMHVHDTDMVNWLFGMPDAVSCLAKNVIAGGGYDMVSTNYRYPDGKVVNAQVDWTLEGDFGFEMTFRVNFEKGNILLNRDGILRVNPNDSKGFAPELSPEAGYYHQLRHFVEAAINGKPVEVSVPEETTNTVTIVEAEVRSADAAGEWVNVK